MELSGTRWSSIVVVDHQHHIASILLFRLDETPAHAFRWLLVYLDFSLTPDVPEQRNQKRKRPILTQKPPSMNPKKQPRPTPIARSLTQFMQDAHGTAPQTGQDGIQGLIREGESWPLGLIASARR